MRKLFIERKSLTNSWNEFKVGTSSKALGKYWKEVFDSGEIFELVLQTNKMLVQNISKGCYMMVELSPTEGADFEVTATIKKVNLT